MRSRRIREPVSGRACTMGMPVSADADGMVPTSTAVRTDGQRGGGTGAE